MTIFKKCLLLLFTLTAGLLGALAGGAAAGSPSSAPLLQPSDLVYVGAFRVPSGDYGSPQWTGFNYGGSAPAYNPAKNSLFLVGHNVYQLTAEISIPTPAKSANVTALPVASIIQPFADSTSGLIKAYQTPTLIGGQLVYQGRLIGAEYIYYDASHIQTATHFARPSTSLTAGTAAGLYSVWDPTRTGYVSGFLAAIPPEWQALLGGTVLTGNCCIPIVGRTSVGPAAFAFDPAAYGTVTPAVPLLYYTLDHQTLGTWDNRSSVNPVYNMATLAPIGMVFPQGTRTLLYFGSTGMGMPCYGQGTNDPSLDRQAVPGTNGLVIYCYDPASSDKGTHGYPYAYYVWAYDANDLLAVKNGQKKPWQVVPYATWPLTLPIADSTQRNQLGGAAYDSATGRLYVSQLSGETPGYARLPVIHVFQLPVGTQSPAPPAPPTSLSVQ